jgi:hypothetical protein
MPLNALVNKNPEMYRRWLDGTPMGRMGKDQEIASVVLFLASSASRLMTNSIVLAADGGYTAWRPRRNVCRALATRGQRLELKAAIDRSLSKTVGSSRRSPSPPAAADYISVRLSGRGRAIKRS